MPKSIGRQPGNRQPLSRERRAGGTLLVFRPTLRGSPCSVFNDADHAGITRETPRSLGGDVRTVLDLAATRTAGLQCFHVDVHDHLMSVTAALKETLGQQFQRIRATSPRRQEFNIRRSSGSVCLHRVRLGPNDAPGPNSAHWKAYEGKYWLHFWGKPVYEVIAHRQNGYLYLNGVRLVDEFKPGLFFASDGEAVDFRSDRPTWRSVPLRRT